MKSISTPHFVTCLVLGIFFFRHHVFFVWAQCCSIDADHKQMIIKIKKIVFLNEPLFSNMSCLLTTSKTWFSDSKHVFVLAVCNNCWYWKFSIVLVNPDKNLHRVAVLLCALLSVAAANDLWKVMTHHWLKAPMIGVRVVSPPFVEENSRLTSVITK